MSDQITQFLLNHRIHPDTVNSNKISEQFVSEIKTALKGGVSSLSMFRSYLPIDRKISHQIRVTAVDIGGTNIRIAIVLIQRNGEMIIEKMDRFSMIGKDEPITVNTFFQTLAEMIYPYTFQTNVIGVSFAYPGRITSDGDMILEELAKEIHVTGLKGESMRNGLNQAFEQLFHKHFSIIFVNDTVASFLASSNPDNKNYDSQSGLIIGTGTNTCYLHRFKHTDSSDCFSDIVNLESGKFKGYKGGDIDHDLDLDSALPGDHVFEKMTGGKYLGDLFYRVCQKAAESGLIEFTAICNQKKKFTTAELNAVLHQEVFEEDERIVRKLADTLVQRAAKLIAANLHATFHQNIISAGKILIVYEGTTVVKLRSYLEYIKEELATLCPHTTIEYVTHENAVILGAAKAAALVYDENV